MNAMLETLLLSLGIESNAYNMFILNPNRESDQDPPYGYRMGFSHSEVEYLASHPQEIPSVGGSPGSSGHTSRTLLSGLHLGHRLHGFSSEDQGFLQIVEAGRVE